MTISPASFDPVAPEGHVVQLYGDDNRPLISNASRFLADALKRGDGAIVIATPDHRTAIYRKLWSHGLSPFDAQRERRLLLLDAGKTLAQFMVGGQPDWNRFEAVIGGVLRQFQTQHPGAGGRAFGEMVAVLWKAERYAEAVCVEQYWNRLLRSSGFSLFCGYPVDVFATDFHSPAMDAVLGAHSQLLPTNDKLESVLHRAMGEVLGPRAADIRRRFMEAKPAALSGLPPRRGAGAMALVRFAPGGRRDSEASSPLCHRGSGDASATGSRRPASNRSVKSSRFSSSATRLSSSSM